MGRFEMNGVDLEKLQMAHQILTQVVDRLVELDDMEPELDFEPSIDIDRNQTSPDLGVQVFVLDSVLSSIG
jgi:uncharacterized membrane protein YjjP (DUF1212 family)